GCDPPWCAHPGPSTASAAAGPNHQLLLKDIESLLRCRRTGGPRPGCGSTGRASPPAGQGSLPWGAPPDKRACATALRLRSRSVSLHTNGTLVPTRRGVAAL